MAQVPHQAGDIFWCSSDGIGQEEQDRHPWVIISEGSFGRAHALVIAVPMTSNPFEYRPTEVAVEFGQLTLLRDVRYPLDRDKCNGVVKCGKLRHWSVERIEEVVGRVSGVYLEKLRLVVAADVLPRPEPTRRQRGR